MNWCVSGVETLPPIQVHARIHAKIDGGGDGCLEDRHPQVNSIYLSISCYSLPIFVRIILSYWISFDAIVPSLLVVLAAKY